jgi:hypothetical protein
MMWAIRWHFPSAGIRCAATLSSSSAIGLFGPDLEATFPKACSSHACPSQSSTRVPSGSNVPTTGCVGSGGRVAPA